jgi:hypothetical protein
MRRTRNALATMQRLERHRGHFYNWYATDTLQPLLPLYVSSVDSGNLAGHLLTLGSGLREQADERIITPRIFAGLRDTVDVLQALCGENAALSQFDSALERAPTSLPAAHALLEWATDQSARIAAALANSGEDPRRWSEALQRGCQEHLEELRFLAPWLGQEGGLAHVPADLAERLLRMDQAPTLRELARGEDEADQPYPAELSRCLREAGERAAQRLLELEALAGLCDELAAMDFNFLFDPGRDLFTIGINVTESRRDASFYDLLASEARMCSYIAIALGQVPLDHWFSLGRLLVASRSEPVLVSWSG